MRPEPAKSGQIGWRLCQEVWNLSVFFGNVTSPGTLNGDEAPLLPPTGQKDARPGSLFHLFTTAVFTGPSYVYMPMSTAAVAAADRSLVQMWRFNGSTVENVTNGVDASSAATVSGDFLNDSSFAVLISTARDRVPPSTSLAITSMTVFDPAGLPFFAPGVGTPFGLAFNASDSAEAGVQPSGVSATQYRDGTTGPFISMSSPAAPLSEGAHLIQFRSWDAAGNLERTRAARIRVDSAPPATALLLDGMATSSASRRQAKVKGTSKQALKSSGRGLKLRNRSGAWQ